MILRLFQQETDFNPAECKTKKNLTKKKPTMKPVKSSEQSICDGNFVQPEPKMGCVFLMENKTSTFDSDMLYNSCIAY